MLKTTALKETAYARLVCARKKLDLSVQRNSYIPHIMHFKLVETVVVMGSHGILKMFSARKNACGI